MIFGGLFLLLLLATAVSAIYNTQLLTQSANPEQLGEAEKTRAHEVIHLRQTLGNEVWPGWGEADIPLIVYNEGYAFLLNYSQEPGTGWLEVPDREPHGDVWELVTDDLFAERPYYCQQLREEESPQAFTVLVGEEWVAVLPSKEWMKIDLTSEIRDGMPGFLRPVFPYGLFVDQLINSSDHYIALFAHESFHAFQGEQLPGQLAAAEQITFVEGQYPWYDDAFIAKWQTELDLLTAALQATTAAEQQELIRQFLQHRQARRRDATFSPDMIRYEQQREWLEGTAKYVELAIWQQAAQTPDYVPLLTGDDDFHAYGRYEQQWQRELAQMGRMADDEGDGRFYYTGWAQAALLDTLMPDWKTRYIDGATTLEDLLAEAVQSE